MTRKCAQSLQHTHTLATTTATRTDPRNEFGSVRLMFGRTIVVQRRTAHRALCVGRTGRQRCVVHCCPGEYVLLWGVVCVVPSIKNTHQHTRRRKKPFRKKHAHTHLTLTSIVVVRTHRCSRSVCRSRQAGQMLCWRWFFLWEKA